MKKPKIFVCLDDDVMTSLIAGARKRLVYAAPSISVALAQAIGERARALPDLRVDVILDADSESLRLGYGQIGGLEYLMKHSIGIRCCPGLKIGVLAVDHRSFVFAPTARIIQEPEYGPPNAINIDPKMTEWLLHAMVPKDMIVERARREIGCIGSPDESDPDQPGEPPETETKFDDAITENDQSIDSVYSSFERKPSSLEPEIGNRLLQPEELEDLKDDIENRPPKKFDHEREILVYNGYLRFVDIKFTGGRLSARTVQLPESILSIASNRPEMVEVKATCKLFEGISILPEVQDFEGRIEEVRKKYTSSLGGGLGRVILVEDLAALDLEITALTKELDEIRKTSVWEIDSTLKERKRRLNSILHPLLSKNPNPDLAHRLKHSHDPNNEVVDWYLNRVLDKVFPDAEGIIGRMELTCIYKDVTWEMLNEERFGTAIKKVFPHEEFTKLYGERNAISERKPATKKIIVIDDEWPSEIG